MGEITDKQKDIIQLLAKGLTAKEIGKNLGNSEFTIHSVKASLMMKHNAKNTANLIYIAMRKGWIL